MHRSSLGTHIMYYIALVTDAAEEDAHMWRFDLQR